MQKSKYSKKCRKYASNFNSDTTFIVWPQKVWEIKVVLFGPMGKKFISAKKGRKTQYLGKIYWFEGILTVII